VSEVKRIYRIALSGSAGTGKSTLGRRLAADLGVPFIEEGMRARLEGGLDLHALDRAGHVALMHDLWNEQRAAETRALADRGGFVADRSSADFAAFWLHYGFTDDRAATEAWFETTLGLLGTYDRVFLFPWGVLPIDADGVRSTNRWIQFRFQALVESLLARFAPPGKVAHVPHTEDFEARLRFVRKTLETGEDEA